MNEVIRTIKERRSIRKFKAEMPKEEDIREIIDAGLYAPSAKGRQNSIIVAVTDKELRNKLMEENARIAGMKEGSDPFYGAPVILIVLADKNTATREYDGALVMENLMLAATSFGLGSIWINRAKEEFEMPEFKEVLDKLGVTGEWEGVGHCAIGYPDCEIPKAAPRKENRVYWVK